MSFFHIPTHNNQTNNKHLSCYRLSATFLIQQKNTPKTISSQPMKIFYINSLFNFYIKRWWLCDMFLFPFLIRLVSYFPICSFTTKNKEENNVVEHVISYFRSNFFKRQSKFSNKMNSMYLSSNTYYIPFDINTCIYRRK